MYLPLKKWKTSFRERDLFNLLYFNRRISLTCPLDETTSWQGVMNVLQIHAKENSDKNDSLDEKRRCANHMSSRCDSCNYPLVILSMAQKVMLRKR